MKRFYKISGLILLNAFLLFGLIFVQSNDVRAQVSTPRPSPTRDYTYLDIFPAGLACSSASFGEGPTWREITIGKTTLQEFENLYGVTEPRYDMRRTIDQDYVIYLCVENDIITAIKVGSDLAYLNDYVAALGEPDAVTYSDPVSRVVFWFDEGIAIDVYINTVDPIYYGLVNFVVYFPYQDVTEYQSHWPYLQTRSEGISARDENISDEQNPFDFDAIIATITAEPSRTPTATYLPITPIVTVTSDNG